MPETIQYSTEQKLEFIANLIVDRIITDQENGQELLIRMRSAEDVTRTITTA